MDGIARPIAISDNPTVWAIPTVAGDTHYLTVVNQAWEDGKNASQVVKPQIARLAWTTTRPIYEVRLRRQLTRDDASQVDLTADSFQYYAMPPEAVTRPTIKLATKRDGFCYGTVVVGADRSISGIPVEVTVRSGEETVVLYTATGVETRLPLTAGAYEVRATELLSGLSVVVPASVPHNPAATPGGTQSLALAKFAERKEPLTVALTTEQSKDTRIRELANHVVAYYRRAGRSVALRLIEPNDVIRSLQPVRAIQRYPQWKTIDSDLVLLGTVSNNLLLRDQARGCLLPEDALYPAPGGGRVVLTYSPFVGEYQVVNILACDTKGMEAGLDALQTPLRADPAETR